MNASEFFINNPTKGWNEWDQYVYVELDKALARLELDYHKVVKLTNEVKETVKQSWFFITLTTRKGESYDIAYELAEKAIASKIFAISDYTYCIEKGDDNDNWHIHMIALSSAINGKYNGIPTDKVRNMKDFKNRRFEIKKLKSMQDYDRVLKYIVKNANKYPEVVSDYGTTIFANYELPFKDIKYDLCKDLQ